MDKRHKRASASGHAPHEEMVSALESMKGKNCKALGLAAEKKGFLAEGKAYQAKLTKEIKESDYGEEKKKAEATLSPAHQTLEGECLSLRSSGHLHFTIRSLTTCGCRHLAY